MTNAIGRQVFISFIFFFILTSNVSGYDTISLSVNNITTRSFAGFGAEWDIHSYLASGVNTQDFQLITSRIKQMKLPIVRVMVLGNYCYLGNGTYNWNSDSMNMLYQQLDFCQKEGIKVIICAWGVSSTSGSWLSIPGISGVDDPRYAEVIGTLMDYLITTKRYSCIKYFSAGNEPDLELSNDWAKWQSSVQSINAKFSSLKLSKKITFLGPETSHVNADNWLTNSGSQLSALLGAYCLHNYAKRDLVKSGGLEKYFSQKRLLIGTGSSKKPAKPFFVSEAGMIDDYVPPYGNPHINEYDYGVFMADYAVQAARSGASSVLAWMLDDNSHQNFYWGMWTNKTGGMKIRPWYSVWSLLSRYFPASSTMYRVDQPSMLRIIAARVPSKSDLHSADYSFCIVNRDAISRTIGINPINTKSESKLFALHTYEEGYSGNSPSYPFLTTVSKPYNTNKTITIVCPANSVTVLTSM
jgi:hypothetical protein